MVAFSETVSDGIALLGMPPAPYIGAGVGTGASVTSTVVGVAEVVFTASVVFDDVVFAATVGAVVFIVVMDSVGRFCDTLSEQ
jgi:hypothetical protein